MFLRLLFFILSGLCILSCTEEEVVMETKFNDRFPFNCFEEEGIDSNSLNLVYPNELDTSKYCEVVFVENPILLEEEHQFWIPQLCDPVGSAFTYVNEEGAKILLNIAGKRVAYYSNEIAIPEGCMDNKETAYYFQKEAARVNLIFANSNPNLTPNKELSMLLSNRIEYNSGSITIFPALQITYRKSSLYFTSMDLNLNQLDATNSTDIQFIENFEIFNEVFRNVYTDTRYAQNESIQIFYNEAYGIVAFTDTDNVRWKLKT